ncbi:MAG TPA: HlyD family efflux transporter periplasmic adaptor subunit [Candidatus Saccharimonadales bacterium]|nr:HlyD family efflux transporter periplasmic adaptor subunit [Candidatus Saccharimonadales bacterium]
MSRRLPALRRDLELVSRQERGKPVTRFLADRGGEGKVFELGPREHFLCHLMDGETTEQEALDRYEEAFGEPLDSGDLEAFLTQLEGEGFLEGIAARKTTFPEAIAAGEFVPYGRVRLGRGDRLVEWLSQRLGWAFTVPARILVIGVVLLGINTLVREWGPFWTSLRFHWGFLFVVTIVLSTAVLVHAPRNLIQAVACKRGGGYVSEIGITFPYYVIPGFYCEYTDTKWIDDKNRLMKTIATGIYYQIMVWAAAMIGWGVASPGSLMRSLWLALAFGAGAGLFLIVANPLMAADGYRLLTTWLEMPQLRERSLATFGSWILARKQPEPLTSKEKRWFLIFGVAVLLFTVGYLVFIVVMTGKGLTGAFEAGGAVAAVGVGIFLFSKPAGNVASGMDSFQTLSQAAHRLGGRLNWKFWSLVGVTLLLFAPYPYETGGPFTILPARQAEVHCEIDGGPLAKVFVQEGDFVKEGQPIGQIDQREYKKNLEVTQASLDETTARLDYLRKQLAMLENPPDIETIIALEADERRLKTLLTDYTEELRLTTLLSPMDGRVVTPDIEQSIGRYLRKGDLFATVEQADPVRVEIRVPEADAPQVEMGARVKVVSWDFPNETRYGKVERIAPIASANPTVLDITPDNSVRVIAALPNPDLRLKSRTTGFAKIKTDWIPVWFVLGRLILRWFEVQVWYWIP